MSRKDVLERAIQKAYEGGHSITGVAPGEGYMGEPPTWEIRTPFGGDNLLQVVVVNHMSFGSDHFHHPHEIIFDHGFAKALWPKRYSKGTQPYGVPTLKEDIYEWQYQLQQMVIAEDPIKYLGENI